MPGVDYSGLPEDEQRKAVLKYASEQGEKPFNLQRGPLLRYALLHQAKNVDYLSFCTHHINSDAWSQEIFLKDLMQFYKAFRSGSEANSQDLPIRYADYAAWQKEWLSGKTLEAYIDHWKNILSGDLPILALPTDRPRPVVQTYRGARFYFRIPSATSSRMKAFCQMEHMTPFQVLLAAYAMLLMRYTGQEDIIIGCPFANRSRPELENLVGLFVNTLPIRVNLQGNPGVREFLNRIRSVMLEAYPWQTAPFEALVSGISPQRDLSRTPIFQVIINLRNVPKSQASLEELAIEKTLRENDPSQFDLSLEFDVDDDGELDASLRYNVDLFDENTIMRMVSHYQNLLRELLVKTDIPIAELEMLTPSERQRIVAEWNETVTDYPREKCVHQLFEEQVERTPDSPAVIFGDQQLTYDELNRRANQIAHYLRKMGAAPEIPVGLYLERSSELVVAILGILKSGSFYVPLDTLYPAERRAEITSDSGMKILVTQDALVTGEYMNGVALLRLDGQRDLLEAESDQNPLHVAKSENLVYIIYTSGSTGKPKGVEVTHRSLVNCLLSANERTHLSAGNLSLALFAPTFDVSVFDLLSPLCVGATVVVASREEVYDSFLLAKRITELPLDWMSATPATWRMLLDAGWQGKAGLKILCTGEALPPDLANRLTQICGEVYNLYGPTEATIWCTSIRLAHGQPVTIGHPLANTNLYILDSHRKPVPVGVVGELYISGDGLARGYHNLPELTVEKFTPNPFTTQPGARLYRTGDLARYRSKGEIDLLGRSDFQVKIRGYRIELGEIEAVIGQYPTVERALVLVREDLSEDKRLVGYFIPVSGATLDVNNLRSFLRERVPDYMVPSAFVQMETFPLNINGKIDRHALPPPEAGAAPDRYVAPRNDIETRLVSIWEEVLVIERIGVRDNFFELGGHSLLAVSLFARIQEEFGQSLPLMLLFEDGTVEALAKTLRGERKTIHPQGILPISTEGQEIPLFIISPGLYMRELALGLATERPVYGLEPVENGNMVYHQSVQETARIYYNNLVDFYPQGPYSLLGHSAEGYFTLELARLLIESGRNVPFLGLLDTFPPGPRRQVNPTDYVKSHINNLRDKNILEILQSIGVSIRSYSDRLWKRIWVDEKGLLLRAYQPEPFEGKVILFSATDRPSYFRWDPLDNWANILTGQFDIVPIPGDHSTIIQSPQAAWLARKIETLLPHHNLG